LLTTYADADYLTFLEKLKEQPISLPSAEVQLDRRLAEEKEKIGMCCSILFSLSSEFNFKYNKSIE
jgi:hypothetical protein